MANNVDDAFEMSPEDLKWILEAYQVYQALNPSSGPKELTELAAGCDDRARGLIGRHRNCPPLVKMWIESGHYGGMTLKEFLEVSSEVLPWP